MAKLTRKTYFRQDKSLDRYLREIGEVPLLSAEEELELARRVKKGDNKALEKLTLANLRFVVSVAKQYQNQGLSLGDLINEGNLGLIKAAKRFDEARGFKFISYAVWWVRQAILQALAEQSRIVRLPLNRAGILHRISKVSSDLEQGFGREPTMEEIAKELNMSSVDVVDTIKMSNRHYSLDAPLNDDENNCLLEVLEDELQPPPDQFLINESLVREIKRVLNTLNKREAEVIRLYFGIDQDRPLTLEEIGERFKLTRERVRQIKEKAIRRLRHSSRSHSLKSYLN